MEGKSALVRNPERRPTDGRSRPAIVARPVAAEAFRPAPGLRKEPFPRRRAREPDEPPVAR